MLNTAISTIAYNQNLRMTPVIIVIQLFNICELWYEV